MNHRDYTAHEALCGTKKHNPCQSRTIPNGHPTKPPVPVTTVLRWIALAVAVLIVVPMFI